MQKFTQIGFSLTSFILLTACQAGIAAQPKTVVVPPAMQSTYDDFQYAPAVRVGDMLYLSGIVVRMTEADQDNIEPALERAFDEIEMVLKEAGASWHDVVDVTSYMTNFDQQIGPLWEVKAKRVPAPYPAWTAIGVSRLFGGKEALIEIKVVAYLPS